MRFFFFLSFFLSFFLLSSKHEAELKSLQEKLDKKRVEFEKVSSIYGTLKDGRYRLSLDNRIAWDMMAPQFQKLKKRKTRQDVRLEQIRLKQEKYELMSKNRSEQEQNKET